MVGTSLTITMATVAVFWGSSTTDALVMLGTALLGAVFGLPLFLLERMFRSERRKLATALCCIALLGTFAVVFVYAGFNYGIESDGAEYMTGAKLVDWFVGLVMSLLTSFGSASLR